MQTCLIGLHSSGKTTSLAALWFSVNDRSDQCKWYLHPQDRPTDASRWSALRDRWLSGEALLRTKHKSSPDTMKLKLTNRDTGEKINIVVPDIAGEDFEKIFEEGIFPKTHASHLIKSDHMVFFVHVNCNSHPSLLRPLSVSDDYGVEEHEVTKEDTQASNINTNDVSKDNSDKKEVEEEEPEWKPTQMLTDSKIIAVLDGVRQLRKGNMPKVTIALTAWDLVSSGNNPNDILLQKFPLLAQYLANNFEYGIIGLSAQGCDYDTNSINEIEFDEIERIQVQDDELHHDITQIFSRGR